MKIKAICLGLGLLFGFLVIRPAHAFYSPTARPYGMGGAYVALADDIGGVAWNPAGLGRIQGIYFGYMHGFPREEDETYENAFGYAQSLLGGGIGINIGLQTFSTMDRVEDIGGLPEVTGQFTPRLFKVVGGYGGAILPGLYVGGSLDYLKQEIDDDSSDSIGLNAGCIYSFDQLGLDLGLVLNHLASNLGETQGFAFNPTLGVDYSPPVRIFPTDKWYLLGDVSLNFENLNDIRVAVGSEYRVADLVALRLGYETQSRQNDTSINYLSLGIGVKIEFVSVDLAAILNEETDTKYLISAQVHF